MPPQVNRLPEVLHWHPEWFVDPVPEWWLQKVDERIIRELVAIRIDANMQMLDLQQQALKVQMEALAKGAEIIKR
jgi:hypothetical protein